MPNRLSKELSLFLAIGILNTAVDISLYLALHDGAGIPIVIANIISTSVALVVSYFLNSRYTFQAGRELNRERISKFLLITLSGQWLLQPIIIISTLVVLNFSNEMNSVIAKLVATAVTTVWNYFFYKRFVFVNKANR